MLAVMSGMQMKRTDCFLFEHSWISPKKQKRMVNHYDLVQHMLVHLPAIILCPLPFASHHQQMKNPFGKMKFNVFMHSDHV